MSIDKIAFFDIEVNVSSLNIEKLGLVFDHVKVTETSVEKINDIFSAYTPHFICGHNFIDHDKVYLSKTSFNPYLQNIPIIDTLFLSMLLYPNKKTHKLDKPYKTELNIENQPLGDAEQTKELFNLLNRKFDALSQDLQNLYSALLSDNQYFSAFFKYRQFEYTQVDLYDIVKSKIICTKDHLETLVKDYPLELAFAIAFLFSDKEASVSSVILMKYPKIVGVLKTLSFDQSSLDLEAFAQDEFKFPSFKEFDAQETKEDNTSLFEESTRRTTKISQKEIIINSLDQGSILAILPTGGGKTFTFQLPALIKAQAYKGLTVVISPLQALMKNHVDSFKEKNQNFRVVAISGYLSPIERMNIITEIENGVVDILYLAPEALRSNSIFKALKKRIIERFVIDEAHCFSSWGHDFRHDYYFIADTIKELENASSFQPKIPISCFTATAKPEVLKDIKHYFHEKLSIELKEFIASTQRYNLEYRAIEVASKHEKYETLIKELNALGKKPTIIYIPQNARECKELCEKLNGDERLFELDLVIEPFYARIDHEIENKQREGRNKSEILNDFIENKIDIVIATTAFGMGIDKPDIQAVIHYEQSDSLEAYLQESGRGARSEELKAQCIVLYAKDDFNKTFAQLNRSKIDYHEIESIVKELKSMKRDEIYISPKELAQKMGIDTEDSRIDYEVIIKTALLELEQAQIISRGRNNIKILATSTIAKEKRSMEHVHAVLDAKKEEYETIYAYMILVMQNIIQKSKVDSIEVDDLADIVGVEKKLIFEVLYALQNEKLLDFNNDISVFVKKSVLVDFEEHFELEQSILNVFLELPPFSTSINLREINTKISDKNLIKEIKKIIQSWSHLSKLKANIFNAHFHKDTCHFQMEHKNRQKLESLIAIRKTTCDFIIKKVLRALEEKDEDEVEISTNELKVEFDTSQKLSLEGFHHSIVYLHEMLKDFKLRRGRLIYYQTFHLSKEENIKQSKPYQKRKHYEKSLKPYYERKVESIHIQIAFLKKLIKDGWEKTMGFVHDYFGMEYGAFKKKYGFVEKEIKLPITQERLREILYDLNDEQRRVFEDRKSSSIMVLAGPGSGKTKTLVHKIASLITVENNKPEYFLMLAHSRVAVAEFKERLHKLIGSQVYEMKIFTFHAFAAHLVGKKIDEQNRLQDVIELATKMLRAKTVTLPYVQMFVLDEYQDVGFKTYEFIKIIYENMSKDKKIIAVGDDDQCINNFGNDRADIFYISQFQKDFQEILDDDEEVATPEILFSEKESSFKEYSLLTNYRSKKNIVDFANALSQYLPQRIKQEKLVSQTKNSGEITISMYKNTSYSDNIVDAVSCDESESIAILVRTNDEVLTLYSQLMARNIKAKYITSKNGFNLGDLIELRDFLDFWEHSTFENARIKIDEKYAHSKNYKLTCNVIDTFFEQYEDEIQRSEIHFQAIFREYLEEIEFDEFEQSRSRIIVSTMHKAKGKEFASVYVGLKENCIEDDYALRLIYVAATRAKNQLHIHSKDRFIFKLASYADSVVHYEKYVKEPDRIVFIMGLGDLVLSNEDAQRGIEKTQPLAGEQIQIIQTGHETFELVKNSVMIGRLSGVDATKPERLCMKILQMQAKGYQLETDVEIEYVVLWSPKSDKEKSQKKYAEVLVKIFMIQGSSFVE
ncbi:RecQ family ATP-dependent DNA helicase [Sulfurospirillum cavolei]|uniref:RecQ family ATP-dependent DNA helicase n=1 Tax=Sulfurospirillum cavolei TaxID=366522 RepID=UPI000764BBB3|nr:RecQ family ATP-dependent DNA helicase [Sulfurospirillum cavolei]